ncbi:MAG TPA: hypothetical protein VN256_09195 [Pyrinomonadaceae bacterium]|nr:hypothetical protein [Pyrinomonadaceae bacterium]
MRISKAFLLCLLLASAALPADFDRSVGFLTDDTLYRGSLSELEAFDAATGKRLYELKLVFESTSYTDNPSYDPANDYTPRSETTVILDETKIAVHPGGKMLLTHSKQYVKVFDSRAGALLQTLVVVEPPVDNTKKKPKVSDEPLVYKADWSADGQTLYMISADKRRVSLWRLA